ncbi:peptidylprolyl isomerase [Leptolyngbya ohadii]|uniref:peptidylprolyl isomerase n=1 Tax=Leptolyngbya ohadii TaxID=1962290 RepID=UPI000B599349|nr:peptidylprolyl isomerase [Leptolyngbya ohadii]
MTDFNTLPFISVGEKVISLGQALQYLQQSSKLGPFLTEIVGQHVLREELSMRSDLEVSIAELESQAQNFRNEQNLANPDSFEQWLSERSLTYSGFHSLIIDAIKLEKLKSQITQQSTVEYFEKNHETLDQIKLTFIITKDKDSSHSFRQRVDQGESNFDQIALECLSNTFLKQADDLTVKQGTLRRGQVPEELQAVIKDSTAGQLIGPIEISEYWWLVRVEEIQSAQLEGELKQQIEAEFFKKWLVEKLQESSVKLVGQA